jgi:hypothetical protein
MTINELNEAVELSPINIGKLQRRAALKLQIKELAEVVLGLEDEILFQMNGASIATINGVPVVSVKAQERRTFSQKLAQSSLAPEMFDSFFVTTSTKPIFKALSNGEVEG